jgi:hypothetical protein
MASPVAASSPEVYMSAEELAEEIEYQRVLLQSLDDSVEDREQAEAEIAAEIKRLERRLKALRAGHHNPIISASEDMRAAFDDDPFASLQEVSSKNISRSYFRPPRLLFLLFIIHHFLNTPYLAGGSPVRRMSLILPHLYTLLTSFLLFRFAFRQSLCY